MMWRALVLTTLVLLGLLTPVLAVVRIGGGGGFSWSKYSTTIPFSASSSSSSAVTDPGSNWKSLAWSNPSAISVVNTNELQVLPNQEYISNNASVSLSSSNITLNVTWLLASSGNSNAYGSIAIGYGVNYPSGFTGNYGPASPYGADGIVVALEHGGMAGYHLFLFYDGVLQSNWSVGSLGVNQQILLGFSFTSPNHVEVFWNNGTAHTYTASPVIQTSKGFSAEPLVTLTSTYVISVNNIGPGYGYGEWVIVNYRYVGSQSSPPYAVTLSWTAVTLGNGVKALYAFTGAGNPVNITSNASSWSVMKIVNVQNYTVAGSQFPLSVQGSVTYTTSTNGIYVLPNVYPSGNVDGWYLNVTVEFQVVTPSQTFYQNVTIPVFVSAFAVSVFVTPPASSYISGQSITVTNTTAPNYPSNLGYVVENKPTAEINIQGLTNGFVPLPYTVTANVNAQTTYYYSIQVEEDGISMGSLTGTITLYPATQTPVIFVSQYPTTAVEGTKVTFTFQFTLNTPIANVTTSAFTSTSTFEWTYASLVSSSLVEFKGYWLSANDGFLIITRSQNYLIPFNGSTGLTFSNNSVNSLQIQVNSIGQLLLTNGQGQTLQITNTTKVIGVGFYYGAGKLTLNWLFVDGVVLQTATANQAYTILTGTSVGTLTQLTSGYTNGTGYGQVTVTLADTPYQLVDIYWSGLDKYVILNITVTKPSTTTTTTNVTTQNYNYTNPFTNHIAPTTSLFNFSNSQPWAELIGIVVAVTVTLIGWKFGGKGGASGAAVMGLIAVSYLGLVPWYLFYVFIFGIAMLLAKTFVDRFMGGEE